jgi:hypothetical protein
MAEITPEQLEELQKPIEEAFGGQVFPTMAPPEPVFIERQGFFRNVVDIAGRTSTASFLSWMRDNYFSSQNNYDPSFDLKSYLENNPEQQPYAHIFLDAKSESFANSRWQTFKRNLEADQRIADSEAFWSRMATDLVVDPINFVPGTAVIRRGVGVINGVVRGAGAALPSSAVDAAIRMKYDPNATFNDVSEQMLYSTALTSILGGGVGLLRPGRTIVNISKDMIDEGRTLAGDPPANFTPKNPADESPVILHTIPHDATGSYRPYEALPTGDTPTGFAKAFGFEKIAAQQSEFARLANKPYRAVEDLANRMAGDYGVRFARAERFEAPEPSASLAQVKHSAAAGDAVSIIRNFHARHLTGGSESLEIAGLNVRSTLAGVSDTFRGAFNMQRPDNKLPFSEFSQEVFKAHRADRIEHPIPEVEEAAKAIRPFFDNMLQAQLKSGYIPNPTWATGHKARLTAELSEIRQQIQELQSNQSRSVNQEALLVKLNDHVKLVENELNDVTAMLYTWKAEDRVPGQRIDPGKKMDIGVSEIAISRPSVNDNITLGPKLEDNVIDVADLNKDADQYLFHGTNIRSNGGFQSFVNEDGSLTLRATLQNVGKRNSVSFAPDIETATDYATRIKGGGPGAKQNSGAGVFKIKKEYLPNLERQADDEFTFNGDVTIPRDGWRFASLQQEEAFATQFRKEVDQVRSEIDPEFEAKTNKELLDVLHDNATMVEVRESQGLFEDGTLEFGGLGRPADSYVEWVLQNYGRYVSDDFDNMRAAKVLLSRNISNAEIKKLNTNEQGEIINEFGPQNIKELKSTMDTFNNINFFDAKKELAELYPATPRDVLPPVLEKPIGADIAMPRQAANANFEPFTGPEKYYLPRIFLPEQVTAKADAVRKTMIDWYSNPENYPNGIVPKRSEIVDRVDSEMMGMMKLGTMPGSSGSRPSFTRSRSIDIPNEVFADLGVIDMDVSNIMQFYARRAGMGLEYARAFGNPNAELAISRAGLRVAEESKGKTADDILKEIDDIKAGFENIRDIQLGTIFAENADSIGRRSSSLIRGWFAVTSMGGALFNSLMETVRPAMVLGIKNNFDFALKSLGNIETLKKMSDEQRTKLTAVHELSAGQTFRRFFDNGIEAGAAISRTSKMLEKIEGPLSYLARTPLYALNGVGITTHYQKQFTGFLISDMFAERIMRVGDNTASKKDALLLIDYGISLDDARKMATMPIEKDKGIIFANTAAWPDQDLADKFYQAVSAVQDRVITTPSVADKPSVMMGVIGRGATRKEVSMLAVPFQLKSWGFAANNKIVLSALQGRDASVMAGILALFGAGYLVSSIKTPEFVWDKMTAEERILVGLEASGVFGLYGDLNFMMEQMSQDSIGLRPMMGMNPKRGPSDEYDALGEAFGPGPSKMLDIYKSFSSPYATSRDRANSVIRAIPFNNLIWIPRSFRTLARDTIEDAL